MTLVTDTLIASYTCQGCGEEFSTVAEKVDHPCRGRIGDGFPAHTVRLPDPLVPSSLADDRTARFDAAVAATTTGQRVNRFAGVCWRCHHEVAAGCGLLTHPSGAWVVSHRDGECSSAPVAPRYEAQAGEVHMVDGSFLRVRIGRQSRRIYAQRADLDTSRSPARVRWSFERGALRLLSVDTRLTAAQAAEFGMLTGTCVCCGRDLTDERSIAQGYGPVCGRRNSWPLIDRETAMTILIGRENRREAQLRPTQVCHRHNETYFAADGCGGCNEEGDLG